MFTLDPFTSSANPAFQASPKYRLKFD